MLGLSQYAGGGRGVQGRHAEQAELAEVPSKQPQRVQTAVGKPCAGGGARPPAS